MREEPKTDFFSIYFFYNLSYLLIVRGDDHWKEKNMVRKEFLKLTDNEIGENVYIRKDDIVIVAPLTEDILHKNDYDYTDRYDKETIFTGIQTEYGIVHVKEKPDEVMSKISRTGGYYAIWRN